MNELNIHSIIRAKKHYKTGGKHNIVDNKLNREFTSDKPNKKWVTNVTEIKINGNKLYLSTIMDIFNREIISYTINKRLGLKPSLLLFYIIYLTFIAG